MSTFFRLLDNKKNSHGGGIKILGSFMKKVHINTIAPDFTLKDVHGADVSLSDFAGKKNVFLVFNRGFI